MSVRRFLLITKEFGLEPRSGGMLRTLALARCLSRLASVVVVSPEGAFEFGIGGDNVKSVRLPQPRGLGRDLLSFRSYGTLGGTRTGGADLVHAVRESMVKYPDVDAAVLDHTSLFQLRSLIPATVPLIVSMHNVESDLMRQRVSAQTGVKSVAARCETVLLARQERRTSDVPTVVCTRADELQMLDKFPGRHVIVARNGVFPPASERIRARGEATGEELLFTGALNWEPNTSGIRWLVRSRAWARLTEQRPRLRLTVAGPRPDDRFRDEMEAAPAVTVLADVKDMQPLLDRARLGVAPLLEGGGSRIKLLEYAASGLPSVSTQVGASGLDELPFGAVRTTAEDVDAFCDAIATELDVGDDILPPVAVETVLRHYSWDSALAPVLDAMAVRHESKLM